MSALRSPAAVRDAARDEREARAVDTRAAAGQSGAGRSARWCRRRAGRRTSRRRRSRSARADVVLAARRRPLRLAHADARAEDDATGPHERRYKRRVSMRRWVRTVQRAERRLGHPARRVVRADGEPDPHHARSSASSCARARHELVRAVLGRQPQPRDRAAAPSGLTRARPLVDEGVVGASPAGRAAGRPAAPRLGPVDVRAPPAGACATAATGRAARAGGRPPRAGGEPARAGLHRPISRCPAGPGRWWSAARAHAGYGRAAAELLDDHVPERLASTRNTATPFALVTLRLW